MRDKYQLKLLLQEMYNNDMTQELVLSGADIVKVGIGPGMFYN